MVPCVRTRNGISTGSSILAGVTFVTDKLTDHDDDKYGHWDAYAAYWKSIQEIYTAGWHKTKVCRLPKNSQMLVVFIFETLIFTGS